MNTSEQLKAEAIKEKIKRSNSLVKTFCFLKISSYKADKDWRGWCFKFRQFNPINPLTWIAFPIMFLIGGLIDGFNKDLFIEVKKSFRFK